MAYYDFYNYILECSPPDKPDVSHGKNCAKSLGCINGNYHYRNLVDAWNNCRQVLDCGFVMQWANKYVLRRISDPNKSGKKMNGYIFPTSCGIFHLRCETYKLIILLVSHGNNLRTKLYCSIRYKCRQMPKQSLQKWGHVFCNSRRQLFMHLSKELPRTSL